jgi:hypothetical protein
MGSVDGFSIVYFESSPRLLTGTSAYRLAAVLSKFGEFDVSEVPHRTARRGGTDTHCAQPPNLVPEASSSPTRLFVGICLAFQLQASRVLHNTGRHHR